MRQIASKYQKVIKNTDFFFGTVYWPFVGNHHGQDARSDSVQVRLGPGSHTNNRVDSNGLVASLQFGSAQARLDFYVIGSHDKKVLYVTEFLVMTTEIFVGPSSVEALATPS